MTRSISIGQLALCLVLQLWVASPVSGAFWHNSWNNNWSRWRLDHWGDQNWGFHHNNNNNNNQNIQGQQACAMLKTDCQAMGSLMNRLNPTAGVTPMMNIVQDLMTNFDKDNNGCISVAEYDTAIMARGFTLSYARYQFFQNLQMGLGMDTAACPGSISIKALGNMALTTPDEETVRNNNVLYMAAFCEQSKMRYQTNCDCIQLPMACMTAPLSSTPACMDFNARHLGERMCPFTDAVPSGNMNNNDVTSAIRTVCANQNFGTADAALRNALCSLLLNNGR